MEFFNDVDMDIEVKKLINKSNEVKKGLIPFPFLSQLV